MRYFAYLVIAVVAAAVIAGFFVIGSPQEERLRRFDVRRIENLQYLQSEIIYYWQSKERLPIALADLKDDIRGVTIPRDPQTGAEYVYQIKGPESFTLCATFVRSSEQLAVSQVKSGPVRTPQPAEPYYAGQNWEHGVGEICFERTIDKDFYPPLQKKD